MRNAGKERQKGRQPRKGTNAGKERYKRRQGKVQRRKKKYKGSTRAAGKENQNLRKLQMRARKGIRQARK
jgi:hypothetical protein